MNGDTKELPGGQSFEIFCLRERQESKEFSDCIILEFFEKGEGRHKRIQAVSLSFFWKREKRDTKRIQAVSPWQILFGKGRRDEKNE